MKWLFKYNTNNKKKNKNDNSINYYTAFKSNEENAPSTLPFF